MRSMRLPWSGGDTKWKTSACVATWSSCAWCPHSPACQTAHLLTPLPVNASSQPPALLAASPTVKSFENLGLKPSGMQRGGYNFHLPPCAS